MYVYLKFSAVLGAISAKSSILTRPAGMVPIVMSKKTTGFLGFWGLWCHSTTPVAGAAAVAPPTDAIRGIRRFAGKEGELSQFKRCWSYRMLSKYLYRCIDAIAPYCSVQFLSLRISRRLCFTSFFFFFFYYYYILRKLFLQTKRKKKSMLWIPKIH